MTGTPACLQAHDAKYAHHGPTPGLPAVAWRYWAMRGESFEPGGCSAWPTSPCAIATMRAAGELPLGAAAGATAPVALIGAVALIGVATDAVRSIWAKASPEVVVVLVAGAV